MGSDDQNYDDQNYLSSHNIGEPHTPSPHKDVSNLDGDSSPSLMRGQLKMRA